MVYGTENPANYVETSPTAWPLSILALSESVTELIEFKCRQSITITSILAPFPFLQERVKVIKYLSSVAQAMLMLGESSPLGMTFS